MFESDIWHWQYDTHELSFTIYEHDGQYWKLYRAHFARNDGQGYDYGFGGQACRMTLVRYRRNAKSPHSNRLMEAAGAQAERGASGDRALACARGEAP